MPFIYATSSIFLLLLLQRINRYDVFNTITESAKNNLENGYIQELGEHEEEFVPEWNINV